MDSEFFWDKMSCIRTPIWELLISRPKGAFLLFALAFLCYFVISFTVNGGYMLRIYNAEEEGFLLQKVISLKRVPSIDNSPKLTDEELAARIAREVPNLPIQFWEKKKGVKLFKNRTCAKFPTLFDISFNNVYWQTLHTTNGTFHLFGAYYDNRTKVDKPVVRILGMIDRIEPTVKTHCQFWFDSYKEPVFAPVSEYRYVWNKHWGNYRSGLLQLYFMSCQMPLEYSHLVPDSVSLVESPCDMAKTNLRVINNRPSSGEKEDFAVCVKGLDYPRDDLSVRLAEWLKLLFLLGANKVFLYIYEVHPNTSKVLDYYQKQGKIEVTKYMLAGEQPNQADLRHKYLKSKYVHNWQNQVIGPNDCLYKNMYKYKYISILDVDEVIMPTNSSSWKEMMDIVVSKAIQAYGHPTASYNFLNVYFMDHMVPKNGWFSDIPQYMHMLQHVYRSKNHTKPGNFIKCFHDTEKVLTLHVHFPFSCLGYCSTYGVDTEDGHLQHYRVTCQTKKSCKEKFMDHITLDTSIWKYKEPLVARVTNTLIQLGFLSP